MAWPLSRLKILPVACPIGWSTRDRHGHSRAVRHVFRPGLPQVAVIAEKT
jgi:hypothetical protein